MKQYEILKATKHYSRTGEILDWLIPYFDQHGRWVGDSRSWKRRTVKAAAIRMSDASLPAARRTCRERAGLCLRTSYVSWNRTPVMIPWCEVAGSIRVSKHAGISAPNLRAVGGHFITHTRSFVRLPNLRAVGGGLSVLSTSELQAPRLKHVGGSLLVYGFNLPALQTVGKRLWMRWTFEATAPQLRTVGGSLDLHVSSVFDAPNLRSVGGHLNMSRLTKKVCIPMLETIGGRFQAEAAEVIVAYHLNRIGGSINTRSAAEFYRSDLECNMSWDIHPKAKKTWETRQAIKRVFRNQPILEI